MKTEDRNIDGTVQHVPEGDLRQQVGEVLKWIHDRAWPLTGCLLFVAVMYLFSFIREENIPVSITSPALVASVPWLMGFVILFIALIAGLLLVPTMTLFVPAKRGEASRMIDVWMQEHSENANGPLRVRWRMFRAWMLMLSWFAFIFIIMACIVPFDWFDVHPFWMLVFALLGVGVSVVILRIMTLPDSDEGMTERLAAGIWRDVPPEFWVVAVIGGFAQFVAMGSLSSSLSKWMEITQDEPVKFTFLMLGIAVMLGMIQIVGAIIVLSLRGPHVSLKQALRLIGVIIALLGLYSPTGSALTGMVFETSASGGRRCAVLTWTDGVPAGLGDLVNKDQRQLSQPVRLFIELDGYYRVRLQRQTNKRVYFVPVAKVAAIDACESNRPQAKVTK